MFRKPAKFAQPLMQWTIATVEKVRSFPWALITIKSRSSNSGDDWTTQYFEVPLQLLENFFDLESSDEVGEAKEALARLDKALRAEGYTPYDSAEMIDMAASVVDLHTRLKGELEKRTQEIEAATNSVHREVESALDDAIGKFNEVVRLMEANKDGH